MKKIVPFFIFLSILASSFSCFSQNVDGHWYGTGIVQSRGIQDQYLTELVVRQHGKKISGELNYFFKDGIFSEPIKGTFDVNNRLLLLKEFQWVHFASRNAKNSFTTSRTAELYLRVSRAESVLSGVFKSDEAHRYANPSIFFNLKRSNDTLPAVIIESSELVTDSLPIKKMNDSIPVSIINDTISKKDTAVKVIPIPAIKKDSVRSKSIARELLVTSSTIKLEFYDSGEFDYDSISVYLNDKLILPKSVLNYDPLKVTIHLDETKELNEISMFANNVGLIPPNSAVLILYDGRKRYEIEMNSDLEKSATIRLRKNKPNN
jgi:hypothetical protein